MEQQIKPCPFCGCIPEANGDVVTHRHNGEICIVDDTQYDIEKWNKRADGWISVKDRVPDGLETDEVWTNGISSEVLIYLNKMFTTGKYCPKIDKWIIPGFSGDWSPSHWMPLPEPPK